MNKKSVFKVLLTCFIVLNFSALSLFAQMNSVPRYEGSTGYPYFGKYVKTPMSQVKAETWVATDNVINDWDWALPPFIVAPKKSTFSMLRVFGLGTNDLQTLVKPSFTCKPTVAHWIKWLDLEAVQGTYTFNQLIANIKLCDSKGYKSIVRIHTSATTFAPAWMGTLGIKTISYPDGSMVNYDVADIRFHSRYLKLVDAIKKSGIPQMTEVAGLYVGYASKTMGDEGIGPNNGGPTANDNVQHVRERLEGWAAACVGVEDKVFMGGESAYGESLGFGQRRGFVEHFLYHIPDANIGQVWDANGYLSVDETRPIIKNNLFHGEENEEYEDRYATANNNFQYGTSTDPFNYRYFSSNIRILQMRCNEILNYQYALMPKMLAWVGNELGRTLDEAPDVWCFLRESYIANSQKKPVKNFERWLFQRDKTGYTTTPVVKIDHGYDTWLCAPDAEFDYIAREGKKIGFNVDRNWPALSGKLAFKVTVIDNYVGTLNLKYSDGTTVKTITKPLLGDNILRTYTIFVSDFKALSNVGNGFDFTLESESDTKKITVAAVRLVKAEDVNTPQFTIAATSNSTTEGTVTGGGTYYANQTVTLSATAKPFYRFDNWTENNVVVSSNSNYTFVVTASRTIKANFSASTNATSVTLLNDWLQGATHAKATGSNRALVVMLYGEGAGDISAASVTYGGQTMTKVVEKSFSTGTSSYTGAFILNEAGIAAANTDNIAVTWSVAPSSGSDVVSAFFANVNQGTLTGASASNGLSGATIATTPLSSMGGDMILTAGTCGNNGIYTIDNGFTQGIAETSATFGDITAAHKLSTGPDETPSLTNSISARQTIVGFVLKAGGSTSVNSFDRQQKDLLYPNPVSDILNIDFANAGSDAKEVVIYNAIGQMVYRIESKNERVQINLQSHNIRGLITVKVISENNLSTYKLLVK